MRLLKDQLSQMLILGNHQAILKENNTTIINGETIRNSFLDVSLDADNTPIKLLVSNDLISRVGFATKVERNPCGAM